jgi:hypothetical protein
VNPAAVSAAAQRAPPPWSLRRLWLLTVPLSAGWFAFWGLLWQPETFTAPRETPAFTPHARFLPVRAPADGGEPQSDLRVMWSPVLFALPTPMGFSRAPAAGDGHDRPRVQRPNLEPLLMPPAPAAQRAALVPAPRLPALHDGATFRLDGAAPVFAGLPATTNAMTVEVLGGLAGLRCLEQSLPLMPPELTAESWTVTALIEVGRAGSVRHVFLDPPSASAAFNAQLTQAFLRWRFAPAAADVQGVVHLHHAPASKVPPPTPEVASP